MKAFLLNKFLLYKRNFLYKVVNHFNFKRANSLFAATAHHRRPASFIIRVNSNRFRLKIKMFSISFGRFP
jgi:hypothetical protein